MSPSPTRQEAGRSARLKKALTLLNERNKKLSDTEAQRVAQRSSAALGTEAAAAPACTNSVNVGWPGSTYYDSSASHTRRGNTAVSSDTLATH
jgi:hypothetical protein